uniref:Uncharacterized protein n=1 Tax=Psilocybe cubensis TaxID=181762 RepID=A0A8H8CEP3_PSICU
MKALPVVATITINIRKVPNRKDQYALSDSSETTPAATPCSFNIQPSKFLLSVMLAPKDQRSGEECMCCLEFENEGTGNLQCTPHKQLSVYDYNIQVALLANTLNKQCHLAKDKEKREAEERARSEAEQRQQAEERA